MIDEMPTLGAVEGAGDAEIVAWHLFLRPTMNNDELVVVKAIARRYDAMPPSDRERYAAQARRERT